MKKALSLAFIAMVAVSCGVGRPEGRPWGNFKTISEKVPENTTVGTSEVTGKSCTYFSTSVFARPLTIEDALNDALAKNPGVIGLKDVRIEFYRQQLLQYWCVTVYGLPVSKKS